MINLRKISLLLIVFSLVIFTGCAGESSSSSKGNNTGVSSDTNYTITFNGSGAESGSIATIQAKNNQQIQLPDNKFIKNGYKFTGWAESENGDVKYTNQAYITVKSDLVLYAVWEKEESVITSYTITLYSGYDDTYQQYTNQNNEPFLLPDTPFNRAGYVFMGWSLEKNGDVNYKNNDTLNINTDIILYAVWQDESSIQTYTVTLYANNNTDKSTVYNINKGEHFPLPFSPYDYAGFNFAGWSESINGIVKYKDQDIITVDKNIILYAVWEKQDTSRETFSVIYNANNDSGEQVQYTTYKGVDYSLNFNKYTKQGYVFLGWSENPNAYEAAYYDGEIISVSKDTTLYAVWALESEAYTVKFDINDGNEYFKDPAQLSTRKGSYIILPLLSNYKHQTLVPKGYTEVKDDTVYLTEGSKYYPKSDTTLYLLWSDGSHKELADTNQWVHGIDIQDSDWQTVNGKNIVMWEDGKSKWYDVFQGQTFMCWAASSNNILLWWYNLNKTYVDRYMEEKGYNGPAFSYDGKGGGVIFDYYKTTWPDIGNSPVAALKWFLQGSSLRAGGGFFPDVFKNKDYTLTYTTISKGHINNLLTDIIQNKKIGSIQITTDGTHVVTFWGAGYDDKGFINKIYITDSALGNTLYNGKYGDFVSADITYEGDTPYVKYDNYAKSKIDKIYVFSLGDDIWKEYYSDNK